MTLAGNRILIFADDGYEEMELLYPRYRLLEAGAVVDVAGAEKRTYHGKYGYPVTPDIVYAEADPSAYDAVVVPGGGAPDRIRRYKTALAIVRDMFRARKVVAAICHGPHVLVSAGVLRGRRATCYASIADDVVNAGAEYADEEVIVDGNLITSRRPDDLPAFLRAIIGALRG